MGSDGRMGRRPVLAALAAAAAARLPAGSASGSASTNVAGPARGAAAEQDTPPPLPFLSPGNFEGTPSYTLSNGRLAVTFLQVGASLASVVLADDPAQLNPLWNAVELNRQRGRANVGPSTTTGHLVCVDGFGTPSPEESKAGMLMHGEAHLRPYEVSTRRNGAVTEATLTTTLPIVQERFTRVLRMADAENVVYVESTLESQLGFDRPITWVEHATVGPPFVEPGVTVFDLSGTRAKSNAYADSPGSPAPKRRLASDREFTWPMAPGVDGGTIDVRQVPEAQPEAEFTTVLMDPGPLAWATALNPQRQLILGYMMRRADYPWMLNWGQYSTPGRPVRGMEFGVTLSGRRRSVETGSLFGAPTYRWLPANGSLTTRFLMFHARVPAGLTKIDEVRMENGEILIVDRKSGRQLRLKASLNNLYTA